MLYKAYDVCVLHVYMLYTCIITAEPDYILPLMYALALAVAISVPDSVENNSVSVV